MKYLYIITLLSVLILSSCSDDDNGTVVFKDVLNRELIPSVPSLIYPTNNLVCTNFNLEFDWSNSIDRDGNTFMYTIDLAIDRNFTTILFTTNTSQTSSTFTLVKGTTYYWRVKATDFDGNSSEYSNTQQFFTEPDALINTIPTTPSLVSPSLRAILDTNTVSLDWNATDEDGDPLLFDLYFGDTNPPVLFAENLDISTFDITTSANTTYYWRVVVKDSNQGVAIGRVWNFRTQ